MQEIESLLRFLCYTTGLPAFCWGGTAQELVEKEKKYCFSEQVQPLLTAQGLQTVLGSMQPAHLYEVEDLLGIGYFFSNFKGNLLWLAHL